MRRLKVKRPWRPRNTFQGEMSSARLGHFPTSLQDFTKLSVSDAQEENYSTECSLSGNTGLILSQSFFRVS